VKTAVLVILGMLFAIVVLHAETRVVKSDITGDNVYDDVKIGDDYVLLVDRMSCCKRKRHFVVTDLKNLHDVVIDDFNKHIHGKEIAVVIDTDSGLYTQVYGYKNNKVKCLSGLLAGEITRNNDILLGYRVTNTENRDSRTPYPIEERPDTLVAMPVVKEMEATVVADAGCVHKVRIDVAFQTISVITTFVSLQNTGMYIENGEGKDISVENESGTSGKGVYSVVHARDSDVVTLVVDNTQSAIPCTVFYTVIQYDGAFYK
jgi:hypothetical protein